MKLDKDQRRRLAIVIYIAFGIFASPFIVYGLGLLTTRKFLGVPDSVFTTPYTMMWGVIFICCAFGSILATIVSGYLFTQLVQFIREWVLRGTLKKEPTEEVRLRLVSMQRRIDEALKSMSHE